MMATEDFIKVSIIVPIYNVENYLEECIDSLINQSLSGLQIILIDDGSPDSSGIIADKYSEKYENVEVYHIPNGGLGHARNYGIQYVKGKYVAFVDSDDIMVPDAYELMYKKAEKNDSDIVVCSAKRFNSKKSYSSFLHRNFIEEDVEKTSIRENPKLVFDACAWNKLFNLEFYVKNDIKFPEKRYYEDFPASLKAHTLATSVSIIGKPLYLWRDREFGEKSITQQMDSYSNFYDRTLSVMEVEELFNNNELVTQEMKDMQHYKLLVHDVLMYIKLLPTLDLEYQNLILTFTKNIYNKVSDNVISKLTVAQKIKYNLICQDDKERLLEFLEYEANEIQYNKHLLTKDGFVATNPYVDVLNDKDKIIDGDFKVVTKLEKSRWTNNGLKLDGFAFIQELDVAKKGDITGKFCLKNMKTKETLTSSTIEFIKRTDIKERYGKPFKKEKIFKKVYSYQWSGYSIEITNEMLSKMTVGDWYFEVELTHKSGISREFLIGHPTKTSQLYKTIYTSGYKMRLRSNYAWSSYIRVYEAPAFIKDINENNDTISVVVEGKYLTGDVAYTLGFADYDKDKTYRFETKRTKNGELVATIAKDFFYSFSNKTKLFSRLYAKGSKTIKLGYQQNDCLKTIRIPNKNINIQTSKADTLYFSFEEKTYLDKVKFSDNELEITGTLNYVNGQPNILDFNVSIFNSKQGYITLEKESFEFDKSTTNFKIISKISSEELVNGIIVLRSGTKRIWPISRKQIHAHNAFIFEKRNKKVFIKNNNKRNVQLSYFFEQQKLSRGPRRLNILKKYYYPFVRKLPLYKETIVFSAYWSKQYSCNPKAIYEYMDENYKEFKCVWLSDKLDLGIPGDGKQIYINSKEYFKYLGRAKYFDNNVNFNDVFEKRKGTVEVQTMHGTPLKKLGLDVSDEVDTEEKRTKFLRRCGRWEYMVSPSPFVSELVKDIFEFDRETIEIGYPRNDKLISHKNNEDYKNEIKIKLGIPLDKKIILYTPTFREQAGFLNKLDIELMSEKLGEEYHLMTRWHYFVADKLKMKDTKFLTEVSNYPVVEDLYLISDLLITDYSSVMFDYSLLDKPMYFYTYDLLEYREELRGTYFNIEELAPGPVVENMNQLVHAINHNLGNTNKLKQKRGKFIKQFNPHQTGKAAELVAEKVFLNNKLY